ncbi:MAG: SxtJ family membrane protein [Pseudomonadota bacterium]
MSAEQTASFRKVKHSSERAFGITFFVVFTLIAFVPFLFGHHVRWWAMGVAVLFLVPALTIPHLLAPLNKFWHKLGLALHHIVNPLVMGVIYFGAFVPMGLFVKLSGKDLLRLQRDKEAKSYWIDRTPGPARGSMTKQF